MAREWKLGDVAMVLCSDDNWRMAMCKFYLGRDAWVFGDSSLRDVVTSEARPLVVIDPEDREQVERLLNLVDAAFNDVRIDGSGPTAVELAQKSLTRLITPPKPDEPTGLGAVVEDDRGDFWVYTGLRDDDDRRWFFHGYSKRKYHAIAAVRILSEGVQ